MNLNLQRPLLFFDIESTGLNIASDCIIELSFVKIMTDGEERVKTWRVRPWDYAAGCQKPINPSAMAVHGIKDEDLAGCQRFCDIIDDVVRWLDDSDLSGFNSTKFDLPMLAEEIERVRKTSENNKGGYTSIMMDIRNGRKTEVDTISGAVVDKAKELGVPVPHHETVVKLIHALEGVKRG